MFSTLGPMTAPLVGGILIDTFGWRSVFGFALLAGGAVTPAAYLWISETRPQLGRPGGKAGILRDYAELFKRPKFVGYVLQSGLRYRFLHDAGERVVKPDDGALAAFLQRVRIVFSSVSTGILPGQFRVEPNRQPQLERGDGADGLGAGLHGHPCPGGVGAVGAADTVDLVRSRLLL